MLSEKHIRGFAVYYLVCFLANFLWLFFHGLLPSQVQPIFTFLHHDVTGVLLLQTRLPHLFITYHWLPLVFDLFLLLLQFLLFYASYNEKKWTGIIAIVTIIFSVIYYYLLAVTGVMSVEMFIAFMLVPLIFISSSLKGKYFALHSVRLLFIIFFFSTALWKLRTGAIFNPDQMSGILIKQHADILASTPLNWYSRSIRFLIMHQSLSYCLYLFGFLLEFGFVIGFFTKQYDRLLIILFCLFLVFDYMIMGICYIAWMPFLGCLYLSKYTIDEGSNI